jgi:methionine-rich copper-binding protein CopC
MRRLNTLIIAVVLLFGGVTLAGAHAILQRAEPSAKSTVHTPPAHVTLWFTEQLEPALSSVRVVNEGGKQVDKGDAQVDPAAPNQLHVSLSPLSPGTYKVLWRVLSVDGHATRGAFTFRVAP